MSQGSSVHPARSIIGGMLLVVFMRAPVLFAQTVTVAGVVVEQSDSTPIAEASIRLADAPLAITDERGRFDIPGVPPGRYVLAVEALGYVAREIEVDLRADTTIHIELIPDPIDVEGLTVEGVTIRGNLRDAESGLKLLTGRVTLQPDGRSVTTRSGTFTLKQVARGSSVMLVAEAMEHLPTRVELFVEGDTTVDIMMGVDSVALRLLDRQARRLASRAESMPYSVNELDRDDIR
ncbi:MAG TPA: carboxypeptidase-like regulatory domain-containing protein, partial [Longimicrobiales bacterium]|nr:carboxypeptidase-like regulatory domain-containing protein [Longimicrobiales bacterium]